MKRKFSIFSIILMFIFSCCFFTACGSNITLTINFDSNGGGECNPIVYELGKSFNMPDDPEKENYIFSGWYEDNGTWEKPFTTNTVLNYPLSKNMEITVYAKWIEKLKLVFESNGGSACDSIYFEDEEVDLPTPTKTGYKFVGWYLDNETFSNQFSFSGSLSPDENKTITVYAKWKALHQVTFNANGGKNTTKYVETTEDIPIPTRDGYTFLGWYYDNGMWNYEFTLESLIDNNIGETTVYAKWKLNQYLTFDSNGGSECEKIEAQFVTEQTLPIPTKPAFIFKGWFLDEKFDTPFHVSEMHFYEYQTEIVVYAKWEEKKVQNVTFYGTPKTSYVYGEEFDSNGMYAVVEYFYYESETIEITSNMLSGFDTERISLDKSINQLTGTMTVNIDEFNKSFTYTVSPKYKSIAIKPGTLKTEYLVGENTTTICQDCNIENYYNRGIKTFAFRCTIIATNFYDQTEEIDLVVITDEQRTFDVNCNHTGVYNHYYIIDINPIKFEIMGPIIINPIIPDINYQTIDITENVCLFEEDYIIKNQSNAYCNLSTNNVGAFTGTLYYGLCSVDFEYNVNYAESNIADFEQDDYEFIQELDSDSTLLNSEITITLENGRKFTWKIDSADYIISDFDFLTTGKKEAIINFPWVSNNTSNNLKIKYNVVSLKDVEYIDLGNTWLQCNYNQEISRSDINSYRAFYYDNEELKEIKIYIPYEFDFGKVYLDLTKSGENFTTIKIAGVDVKLKYMVEEIKNVILDAYPPNVSHYPNPANDIILGSQTSLRDVNLFAIYNDDMCANINNQRFYYGNNESNLEGTKYFEYEIIEDIDTSTEGLHYAKIKLCGEEFEIEYNVVQELNV